MWNADKGLPDHYEHHNDSKMLSNFPVITANVDAKLSP